MEKLNTIYVCDICFYNLDEEEANVPGICYSCSEPAFSGDSIDYKKESHWLSVDKKNNISLNQSKIEKCSHNFLDTRKSIKYAQSISAPTVREKFLIIHQVCILCGLHKETEIHISNDTIIMGRNNKRGLKVS